MISDHVPPATLRAALWWLAFRPDRSPRLRWAWLFAVLALRTRPLKGLSRAFYGLARRINPEGGA